MAEHRRPPEHHLSSNIAEREKLFLERLDTIERASRFVSRRGGLLPDEAEDFAAHVKLKLIENHYAIIGKYEGKSTFAAFIFVVIRRMFLDYRVSEWGKWHSSAKAERLGEVAVALEALLYRDGHTVAEADASLRRRWPNLGRGDVEKLAAEIPPRLRRPRPVDLEVAELEGAASLSADWGDSTERTTLSRKVEAIVRASMSELDHQDRLIFRLRFEGGMSVADISRTLRMKQKPLYARLRRSLLVLRRHLEAAEITPGDVQELLGWQHVDLDFGFGGLPDGSQWQPPDEEDR